MFKDRVFIIAIVISLAWHIFWLSAITIVTAPKDARAVRFSKVSFLGPILEKGAFSFDIGPKERSLLEKRFLANVERMDTSAANTAKDAAKMRFDTAGDDSHMKGLVEEAVRGRKISPGDDIE
jgi:hypothetical protein